MSNSLSKYDADPKNFNFVLREAIKQKLAAVPCYVPMSVIREDMEAWESILNFKLNSKLPDMFGKHVIFYVDIDSLLPDTMFSGRLSGQFIELVSVAQYHELLRKIKQEKLKAIVIP